MYIFVQQKKIFLKGVDFVYIFLKQKVYNVVRMKGKKNVEKKVENIKRKKTMLCKYSSHDRSKY
jgi:hypothetical protein